MGDVDKTELVSGAFTFVSLIAILIQARKMAKGRVRLTLIFCCILAITETGVLAILYAISDSRMVLAVAYIFFLAAALVVACLMPLWLILQTAIWMGVKKEEPEEIETDQE